MITDTFHYAYINAKIRSLKGYLLKQTDYEGLLKAKGYTGLAESLRFYVYGEDIDKEVNSYDELIELYYNRLFKDYVMIIDSFSGEKRELFFHLYHRYELENLKVILRSICYEKPKKNLHKLLYQLIKYQTIPLDQLLGSDDIDKFIILLKNTLYYDPLENALYRFEKEGESFPLEMAIDLTYFKRLWEIIFSLSRSEQKIAKSLMGIQMDILNISWIIRFKDMYHFSPEEILNYSLIYGRYITQNIRKKLAYSINQDDIIAHLNNTPYRDYLNDINDPDIGYIKLLQYLLIMAKKNWCGFPFQIGTVLDYIFFKEMEVRNLVTITEMKRMGVSTDYINKYIVNP